MIQTCGKCHHLLLAYRHPCRECGCTWNRSDTPAEARMRSIRRRLCWLLGHRREFDDVSAGHCLWCSARLQLVASATVGEVVTYRLEWDRRPNRPRVAA